MDIVLKDKLIFLPGKIIGNDIKCRMDRTRKTGSLEMQHSEYLDLLIPVKKKLYNFVHKSLNFSGDSDDIYQETLLKGFKYFASYNREKSFNTWLFTIASNLIKDYFRGKTIILAIEDTDGVNPDPERHKEQVREIYHAVHRLKPHQRQVFFLFYYNEFKISEIARITGLTESNIKFILNQSRKRLKEFLEVEK